MPDENKKLMVKVIFIEIEPPMLIEKDYGTQAKYEDKEVWINLNRPRYAALVIAEVFERMVDIKNDFGTKELNGENILRSMGYEFQNFSDRIGRKA